MKNVAHRVLARTNTSNVGRAAQAKRDFGKVFAFIREGDEPGLKKHLASLKRNAARYRKMAAWAVGLFYVEPPCTMGLVDELAQRLMAVTGWSRSRVLCEGLMLLLEKCMGEDGTVALPQDYRAATPKDNPRYRGKPSLGNVLDDFRELVETDAWKSAEALAKRGELTPPDELGASRQVAA